MTCRLLVEHLPDLYENSLSKLNALTFTGCRISRKSTIDSSLRFNSSSDEGLPEFAIRYHLDKRGKIWENLEKLGSKIRNCIGTTHPAALPHEAVKLYLKLKFMIVFSSERRTKKGKVEGRGKNKVYTEQVMPDMYFRTKSGVRVSSAWQGQSVRTQSKQQSVISLLV